MTRVGRATPLSLPCWAIVAAVLAAVLPAAAQSNGVPGPADYTAFTRFITDRNIFDPSRYGHSTPSRVYRVRRSDPMFTLVGMMDYGKGLFAFFDGNNSDLRQVLEVSGKIAGYTVKEITLSQVTLQAPNQKQTVMLKVGAGMRQENGVWVLTKPGELPEGNSESGTTAETGSNPNTGASPASASEPNDILKRLMEQREKELK